MNYIPMEPDLGLTGYLVAGIVVLSLVIPILMSIKWSEEDKEFLWRFATLILFAMVVLTPMAGLYIYKQNTIKEYYQNINMSPRQEIPFSGEIVPAIGTGWNAYNTYTIQLHNVDNKMMRIVEPPDFGGFLPIPGKRHDFQLSGDNYMMPFYHANPCVSTDIFIYNETHYEHTVIKQCTLCM
jgi:hypothetical protein